jgi:hypothetical protein
MTNLLYNSTRTFSALARTDGFSESDHSYAWTFSDGDSGTGKNVVKTLSNLGALTASVEATNTLTKRKATDSAIYNVVTPAWSSIDVNIPEKMEYILAETLNDGRVLLFGGEWVSAGSQMSYIFDGVTFTATEPLVHKRSGSYKGPFSVVLNDGRVMVVGSVSGGLPGEASAEIFNPADNTWSLAAPPPFAYGISTAVTKLSDGRVFAPDRRTGGPWRSGIYDPTNDSWFTTSVQPWQGEAAFNIDNDRLLVFSPSRSQAMIYTISTDSWTSGTDVGALFLDGTRPIRIGNKIYYDNSSNRTIVEFDLPTLTFALKTTVSPYSFLNTKPIALGNNYIMYVGLKRNVSSYGSFIYSILEDAFYGFYDFDYPSGLGEVGAGTHPAFLNGLPFFCTTYGSVAPYTKPQSFSVGSLG